MYFRAGSDPRRGCRAERREHRGMTPILSEEQVWGEENKMASLIHKRDLPRLNLLVLRTSCATTEESHDLVRKREARLQWMRERGMTYLGDPIDKRETRPQWRSGARLISFQRHWEQRAEGLTAPEDEEPRPVRPSARSTGE
jgi:hypothetical protein